MINMLTATENLLADKLVCAILCDAAPKQNAKLQGAAAQVCSSNACR